MTGNHPWALEKENACSGAPGIGRPGAFVTYPGSAMTMFMLNLENASSDGRARGGLAW